MAEEYKGNSYKSREKRQKAEMIEPPVKKVEKVITGGAKLKKKSELQKLRDTFISEDIGNVKSYILKDVLVPRIRDAIADIIKNTTDMVFYGTTRRTTTSSGKPIASKISYDGMFRGSTQNREPVKTRNGFDFDEITFQSRGDAELVLSTMEDMIEQYKVVTVGELYNLADVSTDNFMVYKYGWTDLHSAKAVPSTDGWVLKLPKAFPID